MTEARVKVRLSRDGEKALAVITYDDHAYVERIPRHVLNWDQEKRDLYVTALVKAFLTKVTTRSRISR